MSELLVTVVGAGLGGLALAKILQVRGVQVEVYESEPSIDWRSQGGTLDIRKGSGQLALELCGLLDQFRALSRPEGQDTKITDKFGAELWSEVAGPDDQLQPEIDRKDLRKLLLDSLHPGTVKWGYRLTGVNPLDNGTYELLFDEQPSIISSFVVGADGTWSKLRPLLSSATPSYTGVTFIELTLSEVDDRYPRISKMVGNGTLFALGDNQGLIAQRNSHNCIRTYAALRVPQDWSKNSISWDNPEATRKCILELFSGWNEELLDLVRYCDDSMVPRDLFSLPIDHSWESRPGVTLIGDAAHVMSPFAGAGANLALHDAAELALAITESALERDGAIAKFEKEMFTRSKFWSQRSQLIHC